MTTLIKRDRDKLLKDLAAYQSDETGFLHVDPSVKPYKRSDSISLSLNFLYCLLLLRTKDRAHIEKAIQILDQLLHFQSQNKESLGNFPVYIHEYPNCKRYFEVIDCLFPLYWIHKEFSSIFEATLRERLQGALLNGIQYLARLDQDKEYSYLLSVQRAALLAAIAKRLDENDLKRRGEELLLRQAKRGPMPCWGSPRSLGKILCALELCPDQLSEWKLFWSYLQQSWVESFCAYNGPGLFEFFERDRQEPSLYHFYMEGLTREEMRLHYHPLTLLEGELIRYREAYQENLDSQVNFLGEFQFQSQASSYFASSFFNLDLTRWEKTGGYYPFKLLLANRERYDSFMMQMGQHTKIRSVVEGEWLIEIDPQEEIDLAFFFNQSSTATLLADGQRVTAFKLNQKVSIPFESHTLILTASDAPEQIWGQVMQDNRRTQMCDEESSTHDVHVYFRQTYPLEKPLTLKLELKCC